MVLQNIIVVGASAGGVETLIKLCGLLPAELPAALLIVLHTPSSGVSMLPQILNRSGKLPVRHAQHEEKLKPGHIYIAPPNHHMLLENEKLFLSLGPSENGHRPSVDALFRSAALSNGTRVIGIILSGTMQDGAAGLMEIKRAGGMTIVQDPEEALFPGMPISAIEKSKVDFILPLEEIAAKIIEITKTELLEFAGVNMSDDQTSEIDVLHRDRQNFMANGTGNPRTLLTCPECGGVLWELHDSPVIAYRCQIGHQFSEESLAVLHSYSVESALWTAVRILEERVALSARMAGRAKEQGMLRSEQQFREMEKDASRTVAILRNLVSNSRVISPVQTADENMIPGKSRSE